MVTQNYLLIKINAGDVVAFKISPTEFGFARILLNVFAENKRSVSSRNKLYFFHPRSLIVAPYAFYANTLQIDIDDLVSKKTLPILCILDLGIYRGEMPIVGYRPLSEVDKEIPFPEKSITSITIPYTKKDIESFIVNNGM